MMRSRNKKKLVIKNGITTETVASAIFQKPSLSVNFCGQHPYRIKLYELCAYISDFLSFGSKDLVDEDENGPTP